MSYNKKAHILCVEDNVTLARRCQVRLQRDGHCVDLAFDAQEGLEKYQAAMYDIVAVDHGLSPFTGLDLIQQMSRVRDLPPLIVMTSLGQEQMALDALRLGASDYIVKDAHGGYLELLPAVVKQVLLQRNMLEERQQVIDALHKHNQNLTRLNQVGQEMTALLDMQQVAGRLLMAGTEIVDAEAGSLWAWDEEAPGNLICRAVSHYGEHQPMVNMKLDSNEGFVSWVAQNQEPVNISSASSDPRFSSKVDALLDFKTKTLLAVPLHARGQVIGVLEIVNKLENNTFTQNDLALVEMLAASAAIAIDNARLFSKVQKMAITDELTGLHNRRYFFHVAAREYERAQRYHADLSIIMLDIDCFKVINDTYGHMVGDQVLREMAQRMLEKVRTVDVIGRYGGEEFAIILPETDLQAAYGVAERLLERIASHPFQTRNGGVSLTASAGVASIQMRTKNLLGLLDCADTALYNAKRAGRNCVRIGTEPEGGEAIP